MKDLDKGHENALYETDFAWWCEQTAEALRQRRIDTVDLHLVSEEIESMAKRDSRELRSRMIVLIQHLLKWQAQPLSWFKRPGWETTIREQRRQIRDLLNESPSLAYDLREELDGLYQSARDLAFHQLKRNPLAQKLPDSRTCPYTLLEVLTADFFPRGRFREQGQQPDSKQR